MRKASAKPKQRPSANSPRSASSAAAPPVPDLVIASSNGPVAACCEVQIDPERVPRLMTILDKALERVAYLRTVHITHAHAQIISTAQSLLEPGCLETLNPRFLSVYRRMIWGHLIHSKLQFTCDLYEAPENPEDQFCFGTLVFLLILRLDFLLVQHKEKTGDRFIKSRVQDIPYCMENNMLPCADAGPVFEYPASLLLTAVRKLRMAYTECVYSQDLLNYTQLLEMAVSRFVNMSGTLGMFDSPSMRIPMPEPEDAYQEGAEQALYCASHEFVLLLWPCFLAMNRRITRMRAALEICVDDDKLNIAKCREDAEKLRGIFMSIIESGSVPFSDPSPTLKANYLAGFLRPGDRELAALLEPGTTKSDVSLVSDSLGGLRVRNIQAGSMYTPASGVRVYFAPTTIAPPSDDKPRSDVVVIADDMRMRESLPRYEPMSFGFCMHDFIKMLTEQSPGADWAKFYARTERQVEANLMEVQALSNEYPILCQMFNAWQFVHLQRVYWFNSYTYSFLAWLKMLALQIRQPHSVNGNYRAAASCQVYRNLILRFKPGDLKLGRKIHTPRNGSEAYKSELEKYVCDGRWD